MSYKGVDWEAFISHGFIFALCAVVVVVVIRIWR